MAYLDFIEVIPSENEPGFWAVLEDSDGTEFILDDCFDTAEQAKSVGKSYKADCLADIEADHREQAMQNGMAFGCDGYNDAMGY